MAQSVDEPSQMQEGPGCSPDAKAASAACSCLKPELFLVGCAQESCGVLFQQSLT